MFARLEIANSLTKTAISFVFRQAGLESAREQVADYFRPGEGLTADKQQHSVNKTSRRKCLFQMKRVNQLRYI